MEQGIFIFDHDGFRNEAGPLVVAADAGDHATVHLRASQIAASITPVDSWILEGLGTHLGQIDNTPPGPELTGFCFLLILSKYLSTIVRPQPYLIDYVSAGLRELRWSQNDLDQFFFGHRYLVTLLKPEWLPDPYRIPENFDHGNMKALSAYPWYIQPAHAFYAYWMSRQEAEVGWQRLRASRDGLLRLDFAKLHMPYPIPSPSEIIPDAFEQLIQLFGKAVRDRRGFLAIGGT